MIGKDNSSRYTSILPGIQITTLVHGEKMLMTKFLLQKGSHLPAHQHPYEQSGYLVKGKIRLCIGEASHDVDANDSWCIPADVEHSAEILEDSVALEIFAPPRNDYLQYFADIGAS